MTQALQTQQTESAEVEPGVTEIPPDLAERGWQLIAGKGANDEFKTDVYFCANKAAHLNTGTYTKPREAFEAARKLERREDKCKGKDASSPDVPPEPTNEERQRILTDCETVQRDRWTRICELDAQLEDGSLKKRARKALEKEQQSIISAYEQAYEDYIIALGGDGDAIQEVRDRIEVSADTVETGDESEASPALGEGGDIVEEAAPQSPTPVVESAPVEPRVFKKEGDVVLNDHDVAGKARKHSLLRVQIEELQAEKKKTDDAYKAKIGGLEEECAELFRSIRSGRDTLELDVYERRDYERRIVETVRVDSLEVVESRAMRPTEYQLPLMSV
jgi:hypothetical protein